jgi:hypothetical protein
MRKRIGIFITLVFVFSAMGVFGQEPVGRNPGIPADVLGSQLIVWSQAQKPQPILHRQGEDSAIQPVDPASNTRRVVADPTKHNGVGLSPVVTSGGNQFVDTRSDHRQ